MLGKRFVAPVVLLAVTLVAGGACSSKSAPTTSGPTARFALAGDAPPAFLDVPFPSDAYMSGGKVTDILGMDKVFKGNSQFLTHELAKLDGFSRVALAMFYVDDTSKPHDANDQVAFAQVDATTLPLDEKSCVADTSSVFLIDLAATDASKARVLCRAGYHDDTTHLSKARPVLAIGPARGVVLEEGHAYAAVLTSRVKDKSGARLGPSDDFRKLRDGARTGTLGALYGGAIDKVMTALGPALDADKSEIVAIAPYTTNNGTRELFKMRESLDAAAAAKIAWDAASMAPMGASKFAQKVNGALPAGFTATLDDWLGVVAPAAKLPDGSDDPDILLPVVAHDKIAALGTAVFQGINFLISKPQLYEDLDHATFTHDAAGNVVPAPDKPTVSIWVSFAVPTAAMPANGYPCVIVQHGLGGSRDDEFLHLANTFANKGWLVAAIDSVTFGARAPEPKYEVDKGSDWPTAPGVKYTGPDGFADKVNLASGLPDPAGVHNGSGDLFGNLKNIGSLRDQFRQAEFDTAQLVKLLGSNPDLSPLQTGATPPKIDGSKIAYVGDSLGAIQGAVTAAIEPNVKSWTLNVAGGGLLTELASHGPAIGELLAAAGAFNFGFAGDLFNESHPMVNVIQAVADSGDSINYAGFLVTNPGSINGVKIPPRNILQIEVVYDELVSNEANEALARAGGYGLAVPNVGSNAGVLDIKNLDANPGRVPLADVAPDASGFIHDTPIAGVTAVLVQTSPSQHGEDLVRSKGTRQFAIPYGDFASGTPYTHLDKSFDVRTSYRELQATVTRFIDDGFQGKVPNVTGFKPPVRDFDDDGVPDATDPFPSDPTR